jgi:hypothetical protein
MVSRKARTWAAAARASANEGAGLAATRLTEKRSEA